MIVKTNNISVKKHLNVQFYFHICNSVFKLGSNCLNTTLKFECNCLFCGFMSLSVVFIMYVHMFVGKASAFD